MDGVVSARNNVTASSPAVIATLRRARMSGGFFAPGGVAANEMEAEVRAALHARPRQVDHTAGFVRREVPCCARSIGRRRAGG
jgi:hypothetical protein